MGLIKCKECGKEVSAQAKACPNCGATFPGVGAKGCAIAFLVILFIGAIAFMFLHFSGKDWRERDNSDMAYIMMEEFVKKELKAPSSASFPGITESNSHVRYLKNQKYQIVSYVDAQNAFGAKIRTHFRGEIEQIDETRWRLISLTFSD
jgi:hypothetical protein